MTAKEAVAQILQGVPDNASFEDIMLQIYSREKIETGLSAANRGEFASEQEVEAEFRKWPTA